MMINKPLPEIKGIAKTYWEGLKERKLLIQQCNECNKQIFYPRIVCHYCGSTSVEYKEHSGEGEIYSYTVIYKPRHPAFMDEAPYVVALVDLDGGERMMTNIIDCEIDDIKIGRRVQVSYTDISDSVTLPHFKLV
jgi:uncharacterized OB-fold protein